MSAPDEMSDSAQRRKRVSARVSTDLAGTLRDPVGTETIDDRLTFADRALLRAMGITVEERAYDAARLPAAAKERVLYPASFPIRLTHLCDSIIELERIDCRPTTAEYHDLLATAFCSSDIHYLPQGGLAIVQSELLDLETEHPTTLIPSDRCADLLRRVDPLIHKYYTTSWPIAELEWCWC